MVRVPVAIILCMLLAHSVAAGHTILAAPNGGETYATGDVVTIRWNIGIAHDLQNWDLWYTLTDPSTNASCTDLPDEWIAIEMDIPPTCTQGGGGTCSPGPCEMTYEWTVPDGLQSDAVKIRVRMDNTAIDYYDVSDAPFSITSTASVDAAATARTAFRLDQNEPNPFNPATAIRFDLATARADVRLAVYDSRGRLVAVLVDGARPSGPQTVTWRGLDLHGDAAASGVYFYQLTAGRRSESRAMILLR